MPTDKLLRMVEYERHQYTLRGAQQPEAIDQV
jgi:hypothetical protein